MPPPPAAEYEFEPKELNRIIWFTPDTTRSIIMNTQIWFVIGWVMMINLLAASSAASSASSSSSASSWFRMKYLVGLYESYYDYRIHQFQLIDNDRDTCTDVYNIATVYAITGRYLHKVKTTCSSMYYTVKQPETQTPPPPLPSPLPRDFFIRIFQLAHSTLKYMMFMMSIFLVICSYLLILILIY